jgi:DnaK suppressor protein
MKPQLVKPDTAEDGLSLRLDKPVKRKSYLVPILIAAAVHVVVIGAVVVSLNGKPKAAPKAAQTVTTETVAPEAKTAAPALRTQPQPVESPLPASVAAPAESAVAPVEKPVAQKPVAKPVVKKAAIKPAKAVASKKTTTTKASRAAAGKVTKSKAVKAKVKPVAKPKTPPKPKVPVLDLDKLSKGH